MSGGQLWAGPGAGGRPTSAPLLDQGLRALKSAPACLKRAPCSYAGLGTGQLHPPNQSVTRTRAALGPEMSTREQEAPRPPSPRLLKLAAVLMFPTDVPPPPAPPGSVADLTRFSAQQSHLLQGQTPPCHLPASNPSLSRVPTWVLVTLLSPNFSTPPFQPLPPTLQLSPRGALLLTPEGSLERCGDVLRSAAAQGEAEREGSVLATTLGSGQPLGNTTRLAPRRGPLQCGFPPSKYCKCIFRYAF